LSLIRLLRSLDFDVLHLHIGGEVSARVLALALVCTIFGKGRSVLTLHSGAYPLTDEARDATAGSIRGRIFCRFSRIIAVSEPIADVFRRYGVPEEHVRVIPPYSLFPPDPAVEIPRQIADFVAAHSPLILAVGGLEKDYDPLFQIGSMKGVLAAFPGAGLLMVGDGSMNASVRSAAADSGYEDRIFIAGNVHHAATLRLIGDADILLRTTLFDGDAISVREAMFLGTPVIATDNGMRPDGVEVIPIGDSAALARAVHKVTQSKDRRTAYPPADKSNITAVCDLYRELMQAKV
jgi:glycosyltransferase involved in cell wall biosynthesis